MTYGSQVRYDIRGHGRSGKPQYEDAWGSQRFAQDFDTVLQAFELTKPFVAAWSFGATIIADILTAQEPTYLSGVIYITPVPSMGDSPHVISDICHDCLPPLLQNQDVDAYQEASNTFVFLCSASMTHCTRLACLGSLLMQPRYVTNNLLSRVQDDSGLLEARKESQLPLLVFLGKKDNLLVNQAMISWIAEWKDAKLVEANGDHMPWLGDPSRFRGEVINWCHLIEPSVEGEEKLTARVGEFDS
ncbi:hypothetical protein H0H93_006230 [Arthromyces matolae]|nr:hypothetical protein H0H93_006230 [Arthromyces matolae]